MSPPGSPTNAMEGEEQPAQPKPAPLRSILKPKKPSARAGARELLAAAPAPKVTFAPTTPAEESGEDFGDESFNDSAAEESMLGSDEEVAEAESGDEDSSMEAGKRPQSSREFFESFIDGYDEKSEAEMLLWRSRALQVQRLYRKELEPKYKAAVAERDVVQARLDTLTRALTQPGGLPKMYRDLDKLNKAGNVDALLAAAKATKEEDKDLRESFVEVRHELENAYAESELRLKALTDAGLEDVAFTPTPFTRWDINTGRTMHEYLEDNLLREQYAEQRKTAESLKELNNRLISERAKQEQYVKQLEASIEESKREIEESIGAKVQMATLSESVASWKKHIVDLEKSTTDELNAAANKVDDVQKKLEYAEARRSFAATEAEQHKANAAELAAQLQDMVSREQANLLIEENVAAFKNHAEEQYLRAMQVEEQKLEQARQENARLQAQFHALSLASKSSASESKRSSLRNDAGRNLASELEGHMSDTESWDGNGSESGTGSPAQTAKLPAQTPSIAPSLSSLGEQSQQVKSPKSVDVAVDAATREMKPTVQYTDSAAQTDPIETRPRYANSSAQTDRAYGYQDAIMQTDEPIKTSISQATQTTATSTASVGVQAGSVATYKNASMQAGRRVRYSDSSVQTPEPKPEPEKLQSTSTQTAAPSTTSVGLQAGNPVKNKDASVQAAGHKLKDAGAQVGHAGGNKDAAVQAAEPTASHRSRWTQTAGKKLQDAGVQAGPAGENKDAAVQAADPAAPSRSRSTQTAGPKTSDASAQIGKAAVTKDSSVQAADDARTVTDNEPSTRRNDLREPPSLSAIAALVARDYARKAAARDRAAHDHAARDNTVQDRVTKSRPQREKLSAEQQAENDDFRRRLRAEYDAGPKPYKNRVRDVGVQAELPSIPQPAKSKLSTGHILLLLALFPLLMMLLFWIYSLVAFRHEFLAANDMRRIAVRSMRQAGLHPYHGRYFKEQTYTAQGLKLFALPALLGGLAVAVRRVVRVLPLVPKVVSAQKKAADQRPTVAEAAKLIAASGNNSTVEDSSKIASTTRRNSIFVSEKYVQKTNAQAQDSTKATSATTASGKNDEKK